LSELYIGLMSGTSMNAIDAALVDFSSYPLQLISTYSYPIEQNLKDELLDLCFLGDNEINRLGQVDVKLGRLFAQAANAVLAKAQLPTTAIRAIGSHGQTIRHHPDFPYPFTLQIADPNIIATETAITTIADFRRRDIAYGGQGAPLTPAFHDYAMRSTTIDRAVVNIGGIANITFMPHAHNYILGFDTGPGNMLLDSWINQHHSSAYDQDGKWAQTGKINPSLLEKMLNDTYFQRSPPKSTGREYFNPAWLTQFAISQLPTEDVQATLVELTALSIMQAVEKQMSSGEVIVCGGGAHNCYLMQRLNAYSRHYRVLTSQTLGIHPDWLEAIAFAWFAKRTLDHQTSNLPQVTGASQATILGGIYLANR
jgi:anhydro-N-acetylmuramic acid kinase